MRVTTKRRTLIGAAVLALLGAVPIVAAVRSTPATAASAAPGDGTTSTTAGASCWGIKQAFPASPSGIYWVYTPAMDRPLQVYCDQVTDGGGWALVGRGRDSWTFSNFGQGSPATVRTTVDGTGAFAAAALSTDAINGLLDTQALNTLPDGIRVERATNASGTSRQDLRLFPAYAKWTWSIAAGQKLAKVTIDGTNYTNGNTRDTSNSLYDYPYSSLNGLQGTRRLMTWAWSSNNYKSGFGYGSGLSGSTASDTYMYKTSNGYPLPFSRVWLRPKIANDAVTFAPVPAGGLPADPNAPSLKNRTEVAPWGVVGLNHTNEDATTPWYTPAMVVKAYGDRVFVGGRFTAVQQGPSGPQTAQGSLAAFDLDGNWISSFRPTVNGRVWDMAMTADNKLIIAGDFDNVNGAPNTSGLAALDPQTGQVISTWHASITRTTGPMIVRALDIRGDWIYAAGRFNKVLGGTWNQITVSSAISVKASDGSPGTWKPQLSGTAVKLRASADGTRVYLAGYFNAVNGDTNQGYFAVTDAATGAIPPGIGTWTDSIGSGKKYQQAVAETAGGSQILVGGSEHDFQWWDHSRSTLIDSTITKSGGDTQAIEQFGNDLYFACHCDQYIFQGTNNWTTPTAFRAVNTIMLVGRFNATTRDYDTSWYPAALRGEVTDGVWGISKDQRDCLWVAGDLTRGATSGDAASDWLGGFGRFCPTDSTPPTTPSNFSATVGTDSVNLSWGASTDAGGTVGYDVYRNDRVIATVYGTTYSDPVGSGSYRYTVRAADPSGNRSATPAPVAVNGPAPKISTPIAFGATWSYKADGVDQGTAWRAPGFDASSWATGPGTFGWGTTGLGTTIAPQLTSYYRSSFPVDDPSQVKQLDLQLKLNAGAVVYVNGVEAGRINMPSGKVTAATPASAYVCCTETARLKAITVPATLLNAGTNSIAVELHAWATGASQAFIDLQATAIGSNGDGQAPSAPTLSRSVTNGTVVLTWTPSTDDSQLGGYQIDRDGAPLAVTGPQQTTWTDADVDLTAGHTYTVTAFDANGNRTASDPVTTAAMANPNLLAFGSSWRWYYSAADPAPGWTADGYDDSTWGTGPGEFGFGEPKGTVITTAAAPRPLTSYYRTTVTVADPSQFTSINLDVIRNSGAAVYVNGVEVGRINLPAGTLTSGTYASAYVAAADRKVPVRITVPSSAFRAGANTVAVELHLNSRSQSTAGFDLKVTGVA